MHNKTRDHFDSDRSGVSEPGGGGRNILGARSSAWFASTVWSLVLIARFLPSRRNEETRWQELHRPGEQRCASLGGFQSPHPFRRCCVFRWWQEGPRSEAAVSQIIGQTLQQVFPLQKEIQKKETMHVEVPVSWSVMNFEQIVSLVLLLFRLQAHCKHFLTLVITCNHFLCKRVPHFRREF